MDEEEYCEFCGSEIDFELDDVREADGYVFCSEDCYETYMDEDDSVDFT